MEILQLVEHLPKSAGSRAIGNQLIRSATSVGANYRAACRARSRAEFAAKLGIVAEEADETVGSGTVSIQQSDHFVYWLELIHDGDLLPAGQIRGLLAEANELTAIFTSARRTSTQNQTSNVKNRT